MNLLKYYEQALTVTPALPSGCSADFITGNFYELLDATADSLPTVLSGGSVEIVSGHSFTFKPMNCCLLLYTTSGAGVLRLRTRTFSLEENMLLYLDCNTSSFTLEPALFPWRYIIFMVRGDLFTQLSALVPFENALLHPLSPYSPVLRGLRQLLEGGTSASLYNKLTDAGLLTDIMTSLWLEYYDLKGNDTKCAPYLLEIKRYLDTSYAEPLRLDDLEKRYHMSKYRICHEFSKTFGVPPLKYLNKKRLKSAVNLLLSSDKRIHEIALEVGYENTNHFINLFKKEYGMTPQAYREARHS